MPEASASREQLGLRACAGMSGREGAHRNVHKTSSPSVNAAPQAMQNFCPIDSHLLKKNFSWQTGHPGPVNSRPDFLGTPMEFVRLLGKSCNNFSWSYSIFSGCRRLIGDVPLRPYVFPDDSEFGRGNTSNPGYVAAVVNLRECLGDGNPRC